MAENIIKNPPFPKNYSPELLLLDKGKGCYLYDNTGKKYLDFGSGISVNALGHGRTDLVKIAASQMKKLVHVSNLYTTAPAVDLAWKMTRDSPWCAVHFGNSGTEAIEAALKYARLYACKTKGTGHHKLLCFTGGFHGRTMGALSVTHNAKYQEPFLPLLPDATALSLNDPDQLQSRLDKTYAAVIVEVIQGEGGLDAVTPEFASLLNKLCRENDIILILDEIQTGLSRTGSFYAHTTVGLQPDIVCLSKALAGGLPLSATLIPEKINDLLEIGHHGTTFGGGPVTTAVASRVWDLLSDEKLTASVAEKGGYLSKLLGEMKSSLTLAGKIKGKGLLAGIEVDLKPDKLAAVIKQCSEQGLLILRSGSNVIRIAPPLVISGKELECGIDILCKVLKKI